MATDRGTEKNGIPGVGEQPWLRTFPYKNSARNKYRSRVPTKEIVDSLEADAVIAEFSLNLSSTWHLAARAAAGRGPRLIFWSQGWNVERGFRRPSDLGIQAARLALMAPADGQVCYSEAGADYLRRWLPQRQGIFTARNTLDVDKIPRRVLTPRDENHKNLLFVGRLTKDKNVTLLVNIFERASRDIPGLRLTIVGDGPEMSSVRASAEGVVGITITGPVYDPEVLAAHFQHAGLFVYAGSIGLAANQALAYGVPVMVFDRPPGYNHHPEHEYVHDGRTGYRVTSSTPEAYAARLVAELRRPDPPRQRLETAITDYVDSHLSLDAMVDGFGEVAKYLDQIGPRRR